MDTKPALWKQFVASFTAISLIPMGALQATEQVWNTTNGLWSTGSNWLTGTPSSTDTAVLGFYVPVVNPYEITLGSGSQANDLKFNGNYLLSGGDLTLTTGGIRAGLGAFTRIGSQLSGNAGLTITGGGMLRLENTANNFTGVTTVANGTLVIGSQSVLGSDTSAIVVTGSATRGLGGGSLLLEGGYGTTGANVSRDLSLQGLGPVTSSGAALISVRDNTVSGAITGSTVANTRIISTGGRLTMSGALTAPGTAGTNFTQLGGTSMTGAGSYSLTGSLAGSGTLEKTGAGTLLLNPASSAGFSGMLRVSTSASGTISSVRITSNNVLGTRTSTTSSSVIDLNSGLLEVRMDSPLIQAGGAAANVYLRAGSTSATSLFLDHGTSGVAINGTATFGQLAYEESQTMIIAGRNGYGAAFGAAPVVGGNGSSIFTNNLTGGGVLTFTGNFWSNSESTGSRQMTINGAGNTVINGNVIASGGTTFDHNFTKGGTGTLTMTGTATTLDGEVFVDAGTLQISDFRAVNNNTNELNIGAAGTSAVLNIGGVGTSTTAGLITSKVINLAGTTGGATINANQVGSDPIVFNATSFTSTGGTSTESKVLTLGGSSTAENTIYSAIPQNNAGGNVGVSKVDTGLWVLAPTTLNTNLFQGPTTVQQGTLRVRANSPVTSTSLHDGTILNLGGSGNVQLSGGTFEYVGHASGASTEAFSNGPIVNSGAHTVKLTSTGHATSLQFPSMGAITAGTGLNFSTSGSGGGGVTFVTTAPPVTNGIINAHVYSNGADFATYSSGITAASYTTASGSLTAGNTSPYLIDTNINQTASAAVNAGIKLTGNTTTYTLNSGVTTTLNNQGVTTGANTPGGILVSGSTGALITGGTGLSTGGSGSLVVRVDGASDLLTIASVLTSGTSGGLTKNGNGVLVLSGVNAQTGTTNINEGTVRLSGSGRLSAANIITNIRAGATLDLNGVNSGTAIGQFNGGGKVTNSSSTAATLTVGNNNGAGTFSGIIESGVGVVNVSKAGTAVQTWSGLNTYTGSTTIQSTGSISVATLANIGSASGIGRGDSTSTATNAASLVFTGTTGGLIYTGANSVSTDRLFTLNGSAAGSGARIENNSGTQAALIFSNTNAIAFGASAAVAQTLTLAGSSTGDSQMNVRITDNAALKTGINKTGAGLWILGNTSNSYSGNTQVGVTTTAGGVLQATIQADPNSPTYSADPASLPYNSPLVLGGTSGGGVFQTSGTLVRAISATPAANTVTFNSTLSTGAVGFAAAGEKLIVALGGLSSPTALTWGSGGFMGTSGTSTGAFVLNSTTSLAEIEVRNAINLNGGTRTIQVDDNGNTGTDFASITGVISNTTGTGNLVKSGSGILQLLGANTYNGTTAVTAGVLTVTSLGNSSLSGVATSVGTSTGANTSTQAITMGNAGTTGGILQYVGAGETSDRMIRLNVNNGTTQIHADGSGPLVLTNVVNDMLAGTKTLALRGSNTGGNTISSNLTNHSGGTTLAVNLDSSATWILSGNNTFTGTMTVSGGAFGVGSDTSTGNGSLVLSNATMFAYGGDRTVTNTTVTQSSNTGFAFVGDNSLAFTGTFAQALTSSNSSSFTNNIVAGETLTFGNMTFNGLTQSRPFTINGSGDTVINGNITTDKAFDVTLTYSGTGSLTLGGTANDWSGVIGGAGGNLNVTSGSLVLGASEVIPHGSGNGGLIINPITATSATFDLNGYSETVNAFTFNGAGVHTIDNTSASAATLTVGAANSAVTIGGGGGSYTITDSQAGALSLSKVGSGVGTISTGVTLTYQGATSASGGGSLTINSPLNGTTSLSATGLSSSLTLAGGITNSSAVTSVTAGDGALLSFIDGTGNKLTNLTSLSLGSAASVSNTWISFNVGDLATAGDALNTDSLVLVTGGILDFGDSASPIFLNITDTGLNPNTSYVLMDATAVGGGFINGSTRTLSYYDLGDTPGGFTSMSLSNSTTNQVILTTGSLITGELFWRGLTDTTWNGSLDNWSTDRAGTLVASSTPGQGSDVVFQYDSASNAAVLTGLEQNFKVNSVSFEPHSTDPANTPVSVTIGAGSVATNRLEVAPQSNVDGLAIPTGGPASVTISAPFRVGTSQTWTVADAATTLTLSGGLQGSADVIKAGSGKVSITTAADATFNTGLTSDISIGAGTLELTHAGALGTTLLNNTANILLNGGAFYYNNAASGTVNNPITMNGGTLSAGGAGQIYSGAINVSALSNINLRDSNSAVTSATARNITLSGVISGTAGISLDSNDTTATGNQVGGNLTLSNNANTWSGQLGLTRGTAIITSTAGFGGNIQFNQYGRVILRNTDGSSLDRAGTLSFATGAVGEFHIDNTGALASNYTVNQNGVVNLNAGSIARIFLADVASNVNLKGGIVLNGNASLSVAGGDADSLVTISDVGISGTGNLAINDEAGTWTATSTRLAINVASTFTGNTSLNEGILILGHKNALSTGTLAITGASTLQASTNLSGANAIPNALTLSNNLTIAGSNNLTIAGDATQSTASRTITNNLTGGSTFRLASLHLADAITARTLTITGAGITTIGTLVNDGANNNITNNSTGGVTIDTRVNLSEVVGTGRTLTFGGTGTTTVTGTIANWSSTGGTAGNITKANAGTLILSAANTYTGTTGITNGTVRYGINNAIPSTSAVTVNPAAAGVTATLDLNGYSGTIASLALGGTGQTSTSAAIVQTGAGTLTLGGGVTTSATGNPTTTPLITGNLSLGAATRTFTVANSTGSLVDLDVQAVISGTGGLIKDGSGVLQLSGVNTFSGPVTLSPISGQSRGVIAATADNALGTGAVNSIFATGAVSGQFALSGGITLGNPTWTTSGPGSDGATNGLIRNISGTNTITGALNLTGGGGGTTLRSDSGTLIWSGNVGSVFNGARDLTLVGAGDFLFSGTLRNSNQSSASDVLNLVISNTGTTTFSGTNTYTGTLNVTAGSTLVAGSTQAFGVDSIATLLGTVRLNGFNNSLGSIEGVGIIENGAATDATFTLQGVHNTSFFGTIQDGAGGGSLSLVRAGTGTTILETENTYTGLTTVNGGLLIVQHGSGLGATSAGTVVNSGGTLRLNTVDIGSEPVTINGTGFASGGAIDVINTSVINTTLNVATDSTIQVLTVLDTLMLNGGITGSGQITKKGAGFLVIPVGSPGYGGDILVESGILRASNVNAFGNSSGITTVASGATVQLEGGVNIANESLVVYGISSSNRGALGSSSGTNTWSSNISFAGLYSGMFASPGSVLIVGASVANSVNKTDTALTLYGGGNIIINSVINGDGDGDEFNDDLIISGATVQLNAQNTYTGPTYIENGGTLRNGITNALPSSSTVGSTGSTILTLGNATDGTVTNTYDLNGYNQTVATLGSVQSGTNTNIITNAGSADSTLSVSSGSYAGTIQDGSTHSVALTKQGAASDTLTLSNPTGNTYSGPTNVSTGTLNVTNTSGSATGTGDITVADGATLAGTGRIAPAAGNSIYLNGDIIIGDSTLGTPIASSLTLATSGAGSTLLGATSSIGFDLFQRGGDLSGTASASDFINLVGILDATAGGTFVLLNPTGLSGFTTGDAWKLFSLTSGSITGTPIIDDSALGLTGGLYGQFNSVTGIYSILGGVPEPSRTLLSLFGLLACFMRRRRSAR